MLDSLHPSRTNRGFISCLIFLVTLRRKDGNLDLSRLGSKKIFFPSTIGGSGRVTDELATNYLLCTAQYWRINNSHLYAREKWTCGPFASFRSRSSLSFIPLFIRWTERASTRAIVWTDRCIRVDTRARMKEIAFDRIAPSACRFAIVYKNVKDG